MDLLSLNPNQKEGVLHKDGPLLLLAGAGSGKTRVLTYRIGNLIKNENVHPANILAITFTNKAAKEMRERVESILKTNTRDMWMGTFHAICVRILRRDIEKLGYSKSFVIYDTTDQVTLLKSCIKELNIREDTYTPKSVLSAISSAKDKLWGVEEFEKRYRNDFRMATIAKIYALYQKRLKASNALDFDDIIYNTVKLLEKDESVRDFYQRKFKYILVDEYQDTNHAQYKLIKTLANHYKNLCVVGDDDQSIYGWRGADISNILNFEKDFQNTKVIKLEQNYRSTQVILDGANGVIANNCGRKNKSLWSDIKEGNKIRVQRTLDEQDEGRYIASKISEMKDDGRGLGEFGILYRTNAQSRALEEALIKAGITYKIYGGLKFYDRKEVKDILAYLRLIQNPLDDISFKRIINVPKRGIGLKTLEVLEEKALLKGESLYSALLDIDTSNEIATRTKSKLSNFATLISSLVTMKGILKVSDLIEKIMENTGYLKELELEDTIESQGRIENLKEFKSVALEFENSSEDKSLETFMTGVSLISDLDSMQEEKDYVSLMTLHSAKGLEFPVVFLAGMEDGIFPMNRAFLDETQMEEERRLCYVGMTRAMQELYMTYALERTIYGKKSYCKPSRFFDEIPRETMIAPEIKKSPQKREEYSMQGRYGEKYGLNLHKKEEEPKRTEAQTIGVGTKVRHSVFGQGMVVSQKGTVVTIAFEQKGIKHIDTTYVNLEMI